MRPEAVNEVRKAYLVQNSMLTITILFNSRERQYHNPIKWNVIPHILHNLHICISTTKYSDIYDRIESKAMEHPATVQ
jgi:hypothetical protein